jgi:hypothetical protein
MMTLGCARTGKTQVPEQAGLVWSAATQPSDSIVAEVGQVSIHAGEVAAHMRSTGLGARPALEDLIRQELLAQEARRRGLAGDPEVVLSRKQALVRRFVEVEFGAKNSSPSVIPDSDLRPVYQQRITMFQHGRVAKVWNVCTSPEQARAIWKDAKEHPPQTPEQFQEISVRHGVKAAMVLTDEAWENFHADWRKAVFAAITKKGDLMAPAHLPAVAQSCSDHVAWAEDFFPPRNDSFEQAREEVRTRIFEDWRKNAFLSWAGRMLAAHRIETHPERIPAGAAPASSGSGAHE